MAQDRVDPHSAEIFAFSTGDELPWLTAAQMIEIDRLMIEDLGIGLEQMMENAGRHLARVAMIVYQPSAVVVLAGTGGNGGGGMVAARNLANWLGTETVSVLVTEEPVPDTVPARQLSILRRMGVRCLIGVDAGDTLATRDRVVLIDALIGYGLRGAPRGRVESLIRWMNASQSPVLALDTPSGLGVSDGAAPGAVIEADATVTLAAPKVGLRTSPAVGRLLMADISVPPELYRRVGADRHPGFARGPVLRIERV